MYLKKRKKVLLFPYLCKEKTIRQAKAHAEPQATQQNIIQKIQNGVYLLNQKHPTMETFMATIDLQVAYLSPSRRIIKNS